MLILTLKKKKNGQKEKKDGSLESKGLAIEHPDGGVKREDVTEII